ncbi:hypothetical protein MiSe_49340 [Microseira wollei NIES-4236]|uniref:Uncharacterized protein n=1 Tax=Microseira wollei NIES-4236 TaxID=2530354 RepID=A0AAV3XFB2_9CYAN|nr:hypothetical protein MiSe_49340 [Microseira wollei NIES-4236]
MTTQNQPASIGRVKGACQLCSRHPPMVSLHKQSLPEQALKALAREGGLRLYSRTMRGCRRKFTNLTCSQE